MDLDTFTKKRAAIELKVKKLDSAEGAAEGLGVLDVMLRELADIANALADRSKEPIPDPLPEEPVNPDTEMNQLPISERYLKLKEEMPDEIREIIALKKRLGYLPIEKQRRFSRLQNERALYLRKILEADAPIEMRNRLEYIKKNIFTLRLQYNRAMREWRRKCDSIKENNQRLKNEWLRGVEASRIRDSVVRRIKAEIDRVKAGQVINWIEVPWRLLPADNSREGSCAPAPERIQDWLRGKAIDWERVHFAFSLGPKAVYIGTGPFDSYLAFVFHQTRRVLLECPIDGNAAYVFAESWEQLSRLPKSELLTHHSELVSRVFHREELDWRKSIRSSLLLGP
jgi:hypothetical protein